MIVIWAIIIISNVCDFACFLSKNFLDKTCHTLINTTFLFNKSKC